MTESGWEFKMLKSIIRILTLGSFCCIILLSMEHNTGEFKPDAYFYIPAKELIFLRTPITFIGQTLRKEKNF